MRLILTIVVIGQLVVSNPVSLAGSPARPTGSLQLLRAIEKELVALTDQVGRTVVAVNGSRTGRMPVRGSGFIISKDGTVLTNEHVIRGCKQIKVRLSTGKEYPAKLVGSDTRTDLAVLKIPTKGLPTARLGDLDRVRRGQLVLAMGNPLGLASYDGQAGVSLGIVSAIGRSAPHVDRLSDRYYGNLIQTTAQITIGHSGGPLFNLNGEVIGINTIISVAEVGGEHIAFAIPVSRWTKRIIDRLRAGQRIERGYLGITLANIPGRQAVGVVLVKDGTPAHRAGIRHRDIILYYDGQPVRNFDDMIHLIGLTPPGRTIKLKIERDGKIVTKSIMVASRDDYVPLATVPARPKSEPKSHRHAK